MKAKTSQWNLGPISSIGILALLFAGVSAVFLDQNYGPQPLLCFSCRSEGEMRVRADFDFGQGWNKEVRARAIIKKSSDFRPYYLALPRNVPRKMKINFDAMDGVFELRDFHVDLDQSGRIVDSGFSFSPVSETDSYTIGSSSVVAHGSADQKLPSLRVDLVGSKDYWPKLGVTSLFWKRFGVSFLFCCLVLVGVMRGNSWGGRAHA